MMKKPFATMIFALIVAVLLLVPYLNMSRQQAAQEDHRLVISALRAMIIDFPVTYAVTLDGKPSGGLPRGLGDRPEWSKDGQWVAFSTLYSGDLYDSEIFIMRASGGNSVQVTETKSGARVATWSSDGKRIAYEASSRIYVLDITCALARENSTNCRFEPTLLTEGLSPHWSPTSEQIVYQTPNGRIQIVDMTNGQVYTITPQAEMKCHHPVWSPDGQRIVMGCLGNIYVVAKDGSVEKAFFAEEFGGGGYPDWTPDGNAIVFRGALDTDLGKALNTLTNFEGALRSEAIYMMDLDGQNLTRITKQSNEDILWFVWWTPESP